MAIGCTKKADTTATTTQYFYDPKIPFGQIQTNNVTVSDVQNLTADASVLDQITLNWKTPPVYTTMNYKIVIYRRESPPDTFTLPDPSQEASGADFYKYAEIQANTYLDKSSTDSSGVTTSTVAEGTTYKYWVYIKLEDKYWSPGVALTVVSKNPSSVFKLPTVSTFWQKKKWTLGYDATLVAQTSSYLNSVNTFQMGVPSAISPTGGTAFAHNGNLMYVADTNNNRILIYKRAGDSECSSLTGTDLEACLLNYAGAPLTAYNVLGQSNVNNTFPCGDILNPLGANECLTHPTKVQVIGDKLFVSDSGNNRIVIFNTLPINGCDVNVFVGTVLQRQCTPSSVIGKKSLFDTSTYDLATTGDGSLNFPTGVAADSKGSLYIADTNNNRVVRIDNYSNASLFNCTNDTWQTPACKFSFVYGQENFYTKKSLLSIYNSDTSMFVATPLLNQFSPAYLNFAKRYFRYPTTITFNKDNDLMILANEEFNIPNLIGGYSSIRSRILVFPNSVYDKDVGTCKTSTFFNNGCDAGYIIGQDDPNKLPTLLNTNLSTYDSLYSGLSGITDFDVRSYLSSETATVESEAMIATNYNTNSIYAWTDWKNATGTGYPSSYKIQDPAGAIDPNTTIAAPDLQSICSAKFEVNQNNIYIGDCYNAGGHVFEIQAYDIPTQ